MQGVVGDQFLCCSGASAEHIVVQFDHCDHRRNRSLGVLDKPVGVGHILPDPHRKLALNRKVLKRSRIERDVRKVEFRCEKVAEDGPVNTQLPLHSFAHAADLIAGDPFATGHAQCRNLPLHFVGLGDSQPRRRVSEETPGPVGIIVRQLAPGDFL